MLTQAASLPGSRGRVNYGNFANGLHDDCCNIEIGGAGGACAMSDALTTRCFPSLLGCLILLAKFIPSTDWNLLRSSIFSSSLLRLRSLGRGGAGRAGRADGRGGRGGRSVRSGRRGLKRAGRVEREGAGEGGAAGAAGAAGAGRAGGGAHKNIGFYIVPNSAKYKNP